MFEEEEVAVAVVAVELLVDVIDALLRAGDSSNGGSSVSVSASSTAPKSDDCIEVVRAPVVAVPEAVDDANDDAIERSTSDEVEPMVMAPARCTDPFESVCDGVLDAWSLEWWLPAAPDGAGVGFGIGAVLLAW